MGLLCVSMRMPDSRVSLSNIYMLLLVPEDASSVCRQTHLFFSASCTTVVFIFFLLVCEFCVGKYKLLIPNCQKLAWHEYSFPLVTGFVYFLLIRRNLNMSPLMGEARLPIKKNNKSERLAGFNNQLKTLRLLSYMQSSGFGTRFFRSGADLMGSAC